jgi:lipoprotein-anchoring transpeptidase ErfK/SrfK
VDVRLRPRLTAKIRGRRSVGERLVLAGRLQPAASGRLTLTFQGTTKRVRVGGAGWFKVALANDMPGSFKWRLRLEPKAGYERTHLAHGLTVSAPNLGWGSRGAAVRALERRLAAQHYVILGANTYYGADTYAAVLAFQKVHGFARTGRVGGGLWREIAHAGVPRARVPSGTHIEISKSHQVLYEVVSGEVTRVMHVSTGATGNTPVGRFRVYRLGPGGNAHGMYYSLYFLRGFAIHGYHSVPAYQASHGCVRTPLWFARAFYYRWARIGTQIIIFP